MLEFQRRERSMWAGGVKDGLNIIPRHYCTLETTVLVLKLKRDERQHREPYLPSSVQQTTMISGDWINNTGLGGLTLFKGIYSCTINSGLWHNPFSLYSFSFKIFFIEVKFTWYKINHFKVDNSVAFRTFKMLFNRHCYLVPRHCHHSEIKSLTH